MIKASLETFKVKIECLSIFKKTHSGLLKQIIFFHMCMFYEKILYCIFESYVYSFFFLNVIPMFPTVRSCNQTFSVRLGLRIF